jgi:hypothetical protein
MIAVAAEHASSMLSSQLPIPLFQPTRVPCPPGDILVIKFGDIVPADVKILGDEADEEEIPMQVCGSAARGGKRSSARRTRP